MLYANQNNDKVLATPNNIATCPDCGEQLRPKCGEVVQWHWAHIADTGCTVHQHEAETEWHLEWKRKFPKECVEVSVGEHRADVLTPRGIVVEFQHSGIQVAQIEAREREYGNMIWVLDAREATLDGRILVKEGKGSGYWTIEIRRWWKTLTYFRRPVFLDLESFPGLFHVRDFSQRRLKKAEKWYGVDDGEVLSNWGFGGSYDDFVKSLMATKPLPYWMQSPPRR